MTYRLSVISFMRLHVFYCYGRLDKRMQYDKFLSVHQLNTMANVSSQNTSARTHLQYSTSQSFGHTYSFKGFSLFVLFSTL